MLMKCNGGEGGKGGKGGGVVYAGGSRETMSFALFSGLFVSWDALLQLRRA